ncbi:MAG: sigma-70 family RNA polymerase sigma factor [Candidatus Nealsonbacteria bacterium]|nr:sigma-70 family RNA polymerase sigma factor [Candidatus Nealsonbacteria bacterium]
MKESINDEKIAELCQKGNLEEFSRLYNKYVEKIYNFIYYKSFHKETAEDLTSETFLKALKGIKKFDSNKGSFSSWLYRIARNNVIDFYRKKKASSIDEFWGIDSGEDIVSDIINKERVAEVKAYLKKLDSEKREIVIMRVWDNLPYKEIAEIVGKSEAACKMSFSRVMGQMREDFSLILILLIANLL